MEQIWLRGQKRTPERLAVTEVYDLRIRNPNEWVALQLSPSCDDNEHRAVVALLPFTKKAPVYATGALVIALAGLRY